MFIHKNDRFIREKISFSSFNVIRLCLSWSALEPTPGNYSEMYLQRVEQVYYYTNIKTIR